MAAQPLVQFWTAALNPAPNGGVAGLQAALHQPFLDIAQGKRIPQVPTNRAQMNSGSVCRPSNTAGRGVFFTIAPDYQQARPAVATHAANGCILIGDREPEWNSELVFRGML